MRRRLKEGKMRLPNLTLEGRMGVSSVTCLFVLIDGLD